MFKFKNTIIPLKFKRFNMKLNVFLGIIALALSLFAYDLYFNTKTEIQMDPVPIQMIPAKVVTQIPNPVEKSEPYSNLVEHIHNLEIEFKNTIINAILDASYKYNIEPELLFAVLFTESSLKHTVKHKPVTPKSLGYEVEAVGLGGIIWEFWSDKLMDEEIAFTRDDLKNPRINIMATAYILRKLHDLPMLKAANTSTESALIRYYGADNGYVSRVQNNMRF